MCEIVSNEIESLLSLGFGREEAQIYLYLIMSPKGESYEELAVNCNLPINLVQEALEKMLDRNLITVRGNRFEAKAPKQTLSEMASLQLKKLEDEMQRIRKVTSDLSKYLEPLYQERKLGISPEELLEPLVDLSAMELRTVDLMENARKEVKIFAETFGWFEKVKPSLTKAVKRGVKVRILMTAPDQPSSLRVKELTGIGVNVKIFPSEWYPIRGTMIDDTELVFVIWATSKKTERPIHHKPHFTKNKGLIKIFGDAFEEKWRGARPP
jgi:sugar-specific transcriptional regulator TrmB